MAEDEKQRDVTRRELADALARANELNETLMARVEALEAKASAPTLSVQEAILQRELQLAYAELKDKSDLLERARSRPGQTGPDLPLVPYSGMVLVTAKCCIDHLREEGEVFHVSMPALYTDDPFVPVVITGSYEDGRPKTEPNPDAPVPIDFRFRKVVSAALDPTPRKAASF